MKTRSSINDGFIMTNSIIHNTIVVVKVKIITVAVAVPMVIEAIFVMVGVAVPSSYDIVVSRNSIGNRNLSINRNAN